MAFTTWKYFSCSLRKSRLCNQQMLQQQHKLNNKEAGATLLHRPSLDLPHEAQATRPMIGHARAVRSASCVRPLLSSQQPWTTQYPKKAWLRGRGWERNITTAPVQACSRSLRCGGKHSTDPAISRVSPGPRPLAPSCAASTRHPSGTGLVLRTDNDLQVGSSANHHGNSGQGERVNVRATTYFCCDHDNQKTHERDSRITSVENRTQTAPTRGRCTPNFRVEGGRVKTATSRFGHSPFVVGGPLCAKYPSRWAAARVSIFNMPEPKKLDARTTASAAAVEPGVRQQLCSTLGSVPCRSGSRSWKRYGVDTKPSARHSCYPSNRRTHFSKAITSKETYVLSYMGTVYRHKLHNNKLPLSEATGAPLLSRSAVSEALQVSSGRERAPASPGRCNNTDTTDRKVSANVCTRDGHDAWSRGYMPRHEEIIGMDERGGQEPWGGSRRSTCFGQYRVLVD